MPARARIRKAPAGRQSGATWVMVKTTTARRESRNTIVTRLRAPFAPRTSPARPVRRRETRGPLAVLLRAPAARREPVAAFEPDGELDAAAEPPVEPAPEAESESPDEVAAAPLVELAEELSPPEDVDEALAGGGGGGSSGGGGGGGGSSGGGGGGGGRIGGGGGGGKVGTVVGIDGIVVGTVVGTVVGIVGTWLGSTPNACPAPKPSGPSASRGTSRSFFPRGRRLTTV